MLRALQITAPCCDTIIEKVNGTTYPDSIVQRDYRLYMEPQKYMVMRGHAEGTKENEDIVDTVWFDVPPQDSLYQIRSKFIIHHQYNVNSTPNSISVDTIWPDEDGNFDLRPKKE